jgi:hypothetical protein
VLCVKTQRRLNADSTVQHEGHVYLVEDRLKAQTVTVHQRLDGSIQLRCHNRCLSYRLLPQRPRKAQPILKPVLAKTTHRPRQSTPGEAPTNGSGLSGTLGLRFALSLGVLCRPSQIPSNRLRLPANPDDC